MNSPNIAAINAASRLLKGKLVGVQSNFVPDGWQIAALEDHSFILLLTGSAGGGKSRTGLEIIHRYMQKHSGATGLMMRKAREWTEKSIVPFLKQAVIGNSRVAIHKKADKLFQYHQSTLYYGGMKDDDQRESIRSIGGDGGLDIVLFEEANAFTEDDFNEILGRMRGKAAPYRQIILMTNPDAPSHWINQRLIVGGEAKVYYSSALDNRHNPPEYMDSLNRMTGVLRERLVLGRWVQAEGVVYDNFSLEHNVSSDVEYNPALRTIWGVDDGYAAGQGQGSEGYHPRVILVMQETSQGGVNVVYEYCKTGVSNYNDSIDEVLELYPKPDIAYVDSSAAMFKGALWNKNIHATGATHEISEGIKNVRRLICDGNGVRLLKINPRCKNLIYEMNAYRMSDHVGKGGEMKPEKLDDHSLDALRYGCFHLRWTT